MNDYVTGVVGNNSPEWLFDDALYGENVIDWTCEGCFEENGLMGEDDCMGCGATHEYLIGFVKVGNEYHPDLTADYSAIVRETVTQVVASRYVQPCNRCSPCYPGQGDLDTPGSDYMAYTLPPDVWGEDAPDGIVEADAG